MQNMHNTLLMLCKNTALGTLDVLQKLLVPCLLEIFHIQDERVYFTCFHSTIMINDMMFRLN